MSALSGDEKKKALQRMGELLRAGAVMLSDTCPRCGLPLFRLRSGETVCPIHGRVYVARSEEEAERYTIVGVLESLENIVVRELASLRDTVERGVRDEDREDVIRSIVGWLEVIERIERIKKELSGTHGEGRRGVQGLRR